MSRHPVDVLKAALQEAKTEAATLRIKTATLAKERNVVIEERNKARARVKELEQQNAVQRENVDEAMRQNTRLLQLVRSIGEPEATFWLVGVKHAAGCAAKAGQLDGKCPVCCWIAKVLEAQTIANAWPASGKSANRKPAGGPEQDRGGAALPPAGSEARIRELEAEVQRLQRDRAQVGAFGFKPLGIR